MKTEPLARTPKPPYYAVIFTSLRTNGDNGYSQMADRMFALAREQPGYLGAESVRNNDGVGITVSYWSDLDSISAWKAHSDHQIAQAIGKKTWYQDYVLRVAKVEKEYTRNSDS